MGINWKKIGQFVVDVGLDSLDSASKQSESGIKKNLKRKDLTEAQRNMLEEKLDKAQELNCRTKDLKQYYHSDYKDK